VTVDHGASGLARSARKVRSGACRAQCSSQSPTHRALSRNGVVDFRMMLPSARRSATIAGVANRFREWSPLPAALVMGFLLARSVRDGRDAVSGLQPRTGGLALMLSTTIVVVNNNLPLGRAKR
jgi:hypothetical protein